MAGASAFAQHQDPSWSARRAIINQQCLENDSLCNVLHKLGTFEGHVRSFNMATVNQADFPDYYAIGMGGGLAYFSPVIKNFQVGMSGFIIYNLASTHLGPQPPFANRYEIGLFDVEDPDNHGDLDRLEDLYVRYYFSQATHSHIQVGKFHLKTPLVNLQDGRMRPNLQEGAWMELNQLQAIKVRGGVIWKTSPRGTTKWYTIGESIGVYPGGRATNGERAEYAGHVHTRYLGIGNIEVNPSKQLNYQLWNYYAGDLFNMMLNQLEWKKKQETHTWKISAQYLWQRSLFTDENLPEANRYINPGEQSHSFSARLGYLESRTGNDWSLNYTRITRHGRFLFPREWGVESLYTFMPRERSEGMGDVNALMLQHTRLLDKEKHLSLQAAAGMYLLPSVDDAMLNKYTLPSYYQVNVRARYKFTGFLQGLHADLLYLYKGNLVSDLEPTPATFHNRVNMHHVSMVLDYYF
jgi:hypothetical protein